MTYLSNKNIVLCVTGSIAAYKSVYLASLIVKEGANLRVIMTESAKEFVGESSFSGITHNEVITGYYEGKTELSIDHVSIAKEADLIVVAPATANSIAKIALGISSEPIVGTILASKAPVIVAPAMDGDMFNSKQVQSNIKILHDLDMIISGPEKGRLASGINEYGRMTEPDKLLEEINKIFSKKKDFENIRAIVTAGATIESIDPVRFISNWSSGKMGIAIAEALRDRGAKVTFVLSGKIEWVSIFGPKIIKSCSNAFFTKKTIWGFPTFKQNPFLNNFPSNSSSTLLLSTSFASGILSQSKIGWPMFNLTDWSPTTFASNTLLFVLILIDLELIFLLNKYAMHLLPFPQALTSPPSELKIVIGKILFSFFSRS